MIRSNRTHAAVAAALVAVFLVPAVASAQLKTYVEAPDDSYAWKFEKTVPLVGAEAAVLTLTSQTWHKIPWRHRLLVIRPEKLEHAGTATLLIAGGSNKKKSFEKLPGELPLLATLAKQTGSVIVLLSQVPNQPLFDNLSEDAAIAYTFQKFIEEADPTWPLLLPMTKSAVRAMDAAQAYLASKHDQRVRGFFVTGASKRGWTTWLTGAVDKRVIGIAPMVIDVLNMPPQMRHQLAAWGKYSEQIHDYTELGLAQMLNRKEARPLIRMVDPYNYRDRLDMPKLIFIGTNDRYWPVDAAKYYFFDLKGKSYLSYVPNAGHGLDLTIVSTLTGFYRQLLTRAELPKFTWHFEARGNDVLLKVKAATPPASLHLWSAVSDSKDFRKAKWTSREVRGSGEGVYDGEATVPGGKRLALYACLHYKTARGEVFRLCTNTAVFPP